MYCRLQIVGIVDMLGARRVLKLVAQEVEVSGAATLA